MTKVWSTDETGRAGRRLHPVSMRLTQSLERAWSAEMLLESGEGAQVGEWIGVEGPTGFCGIFRVSMTELLHPDGLQRATLEHGIRTLEDDVLAGEYGPAELGGTKTAVSVRQALSAILAAQEHPRWALGECECDETQGWVLRDMTLREAAERVRNSLPGYEWAWNQQTTPWTLELRKSRADGMCEMRLKRSIEGLEATLDREGMYTRLYVFGKDDMTLEDGPYLEENTQTWGVVSAVYREPGITDRTKLRERAEYLLHAHSRPALRVRLTGQELSLLTGEELDRLTLGRNCRVPLPAYGTWIEERITQIEWPDAVGEPSRIEIELAGGPATLTSRLMRVDTLIGGITRGRGGTKKALDDAAEELHWTSIAKTDRWLRLMAEAITGCGTDDETIRRALIQITSDGILARVSSGEVASVINQSAEEVRIDAKRVNLSGYVTASQLSATNATIQNLISGATTASTLKANLISAGTGLNYQGHAISLQSVNIDGTSYHLMGYKG